MILDRIAESNVILLANTFHFRVFYVKRLALNSVVELLDSSFLTIS